MSSSNVLSSNKFNNKIYYYQEKVKIQEELKKDP